MAKIMPLSILKLSSSGHFFLKFALFR